MDFIYQPDVESNLLVRDLHVQLGVGIIPEGGKMVVKIMRSTEIDIKEIDLRLWAREGETANLDIPPIKVEMKEGTTNIRVKQYPMSQEARQGLAPVIERLLTEGILKPCIPPITPLSLR